MKKLLLFAAASCFFAACNSGSTEQNTMNPEAVNATDKTEVNDPSMAVETDSSVPLPGKDPVCDMDRNSSWTEYSVHETDTTWFCSPHCKETFDKDPAKYLSKK